MRAIVNCSGTCLCRQPYRMTGNSQKVTKGFKIAHIVYISILCIPVGYFFIFIGV